jgi:hypothetical protein
VGQHFESGSSNVILANTVQTVNIGTRFVAVGSTLYHGYHETYVTGVDVSSGACESLDIGGKFAGAGATTGVKCSVGTGIRLDNIHAKGSHSSSLIELTAGPGNVTIGRNIKHEESGGSTFIKWPINHRDLDHYLENDARPVATGFQTQVVSPANTSENNIYTRSFPRALLGEKSAIRFELAGDVVNTNGNKVLRLKLDSTTLATITVTGAEVGGLMVDGQINIHSAVLATGWCRVFVGTAFKGMFYFNSGAVIALSTTDPVFDLTVQLANAGDQVRISSARITVDN